MCHQWFLSCIITCQPDFLTASSFCHAIWKTCHMYALYHTLDTHVSSCAWQFCPIPALHATTLGDPISAAIPTCADCFLSGAGVMIGDWDSTLSAEWHSPNKIVLLSGTSRGHCDVIISTRSGGAGSCTVKFRGQFPSGGYQVRI